MSIIPAQPAPRDRAGKRIHTPRPDWTKEQEDEIVHMYTIDKVYSTQIAKRIDQPYRYVRDLLHERGVLKDPVGTVVVGENEEAQIIDLYAQGRSLEDLARQFECSYMVIKRCLLNRGVSIRGASSLFTATEELEIVQMYNEGATVSAIAKLRGCSLGPLDRVLRKHNVTTRHGKELSAHWAKKNAHKVLPPYVYIGRRQTALKSGHKWEITEEDIEAIFKEQNGLCYYTGLPMQTASRKQEYIATMKVNPLALSIDRRNSDGHYTKDNVVLCCRFINLAKSAYPEDVFKAVLAQAAASIVAKTQIPV